MGEGPKESFYVLTPTDEPSSLRQALSLAWGELGRVVKQRTLYFVGRTRVHVDRVEGLGDFLELEVVLAEDEPLDSGIKEAEQIMVSLGISDDMLVKGGVLRSSWPPGNQIRLVRQTHEAIPGAGFAGGPRL